MQETRAKSSAFSCRLLYRITSMTPEPERTCCQQNSFWVWICLLRFLLRWVVFVCSLSRLPLVASHISCPSIHFSQSFLAFVRFIDGRLNTLLSQSCPRGHDSWVASVVGCIVRPSSSLCVGIASQRIHDAPCVTRSDCVTQMTPPVWKKPRDASDVKLSDPTHENKRRTVKLVDVRRNVSRRCIWCETKRL